MGLAIELLFVALVLGYDNYTVCAISIQVDRTICVSGAVLDNMDNGGKLSLVVRLQSIYATVKSSLPAFVFVQKAISGFCTFEGLVCEYIVAFGDSDMLISVHHHPVVGNRVWLVHNIVFKRVMQSEFVEEGQDFEIIDQERDLLRYHSRDGEFVRACIMTNV